MAPLNTRIPERLLGLGAVLLLLLAPLALGGPDLAGHGGRGWFGDNVDIFYPSRVEAARQWTEGRVPLWNPYKRAGAPLLGDVVTAALYPPNIVFAAPEEQHRTIMDLMVLLHQGLAGCFAYFFLRTLGLVRAAALLGSLVYSLNGYMVLAGAFWIGMQNTMVWAPLVLACLERSRAEGCFLRWTFLGAGAYAIQILAGFPEYAFYTALLAGGLALMRAWQDPRKWARPIGGLLLMGIGGALMAAPQIVPTFEVAANSMRPLVLPLKELVGARIGVAPSALLGLVIPGTVMVGWAKICAYLGIAALCFSGAVLRRIDGLSIYALAVSVVALILIMGTFSPLGPIGHYIPGLNTFRGPWKHIFELTLGVALVAALGADRLLRGDRGSRWAVCGVALSLCALAGYRLYATGSDTEPSLGYLLSTLGVPLAVACLTVVRRERAAVAVAIVGLVWGLAQHRADCLPRDLIDKQPPSLTRLTHEGVSRMLVLRKPLQPTGNTVLTGDWATCSRIPAVHGSGPFRWKPLADALTMTATGWLQTSRVLKLEDQTLDVLGVRYILSSRGRDGGVFGEPVLRAIPGARFTEEADFLLVERPRVLPFGYVARSVVCRDDADELIHRRTYDLNETAIISCPAGETGERLASSPGTTELLRAEPGRAELGVAIDGPSPGLLVVRQPDYPGWLAAIDGKDTSIVRTNALVQGVWVPPGVHQVELRYDPLGFRVGVLLSIATLLVFGVSLFWNRARSRGSRLHRAP